MLFAKKRNESNILGHPKKESWSNTLGRREYLLLDKYIARNLTPNELILFYGVWKRISWNFISYIKMWIEIWNIFEIIFILCKLCCLAISILCDVAYLFRLYRMCYTKRYKLNSDPSKGRALTRTSVHVDYVIVRVVSLVTVESWLCHFPDTRYADITNSRKTLDYSIEL